MSKNTEKLEANLSMLVMSIGSSSLMAMGILPDPTTGKTAPKNKEMARFNIDLLLVLQEKTKGNLSKEESDILNNILNDLQLKFVQECK